MRRFFEAVARALRGRRELAVALATAIVRGRGRLYGRSRLPVPPGGAGTAPPVH